MFRLPTYVRYTALSNQSAPFNPKDMENFQSFMEVLNHTFEQSEQLAMIIHFKGKATVKTAPLSELRPPKDALTDRGLSAVIE